MNRLAPRGYSRIAWLIVFGMCLLFVDFISKAYVFHLLPFDEGARVRDIPIFYDLFGIDFLISMVSNKGAAWGFFADFQPLLMIVRIAMIIGMFIYLFFFNVHRTLYFPLVCVISGAIGNIVDFFLYGFVVDFLHFNLWGYHFPVFNFADTCITIGVAWLFIASFFTKDYVRT